MNAIHRTGVDGLLDAFSGVTVLANGTGSTVPGFNNKCVSCHMGAISTTNTCGFIDPDGLFPKGSTEQRFTPRRLILRLGELSEGERWIVQFQASQRVTTNSIAPSTV